MKKLLATLEFKEIKLTINGQTEMGTLFLDTELNMFYLSYNHKNGSEQRSYFNIDKVEYVRIKRNIEEI